MIKYLLNKIRDKLDTEVSMVVVTSEKNEIDLCKKVISSVKINHESYAIIFTDHEYMIEFRLPYNKFLKFMKELNKNGYTLRIMSKVDLINKIVKVNN